MNQDINIKKLRINCFRQSKVPGQFMLQMRVPGGFIDSSYLSVIEHIAKTSGRECLFGRLYQRGGCPALPGRYGHSIA